MKSSSTKNGLLFLAGLVVLIIARLLPVLKQPVYTYGYDYGFYLYALNHPPAFNPINFFGGIFGTYFNPLFFLFHSLTLPPRVTLNISYFIIAIIAGIAFYFLMNKYSRAGVFALILTAVSVSQIQTYTMFLWKNMLGLVWLLLALKFVQEKKWGWLAFILLLLFLTHRTTLIILLAALAVYVIYELIRQKQYKWLVGVPVVLACALPFGRPFYHNFLNNPNPDVAAGIFLNLFTAFKFTWPVMILAAWGLFSSLKRSESIFMIFFFITSLLWVILRLPFHNRVILYLDLSIVFFAAYFLGLQLTTKNFYSRLITFTLLGLAVILGSIYTLRLQPLITLNQVEEIREFTEHLNYGFVLAVDSNDAPWLLGFSKNVRLGAPGLFENPHTYQEWQTFWAGARQKEFLSVYPKPLYIYQRSGAVEGDAQACLNQVSENFYLYGCP